MSTGSTPAEGADLLVPEQELLVTALQLRCQCNRASNHWGHEHCHPQRGGRQSLKSDWQLCLNLLFYFLKTSIFLLNQPGGLKIPRIASDLP